MIDKEKWYDVNEVSRTYYFNDSSITFNGVAQVRVSKSHTHFLKLTTGKGVIVHNTWLAVEIDGQFID